MTAPTVQIEYFSDVLCVWAWIAQRRIDELHKQFGSRIQLHSSFVDVFGDTAARISENWQDRGGFDGFASHVRKSAAPYETAPVSERAWTEARPASSATAHLVIKAAGVLSGEAAADGLALRVRKEFFVNGADIGRLDVLHDIAAAEGLNADALRRIIEGGEPMARLMSDYRKASRLGVKGSPVFLMNSNRQTLYGNVGYRVLQANVEELLRRPESEASWC